MNFPSRFSKTFNAPPLILRMIVVPEGVKVGLYSGDKVASYADVMSARGLPEPLIRFLQTRGKPQEHIYRLAWPDAKELHDALRATPSDKLILEADDLEQLTRIERPANFRIHWLYNASQKRLERQLINADIHLGKGWFSEGKRIWVLHRNVPEWAAWWLSQPTIPSAQIYRFVSDFVTAAEYAHWPISCDLHITRDLSLRLELIRLLDRSIDVQLTSSEPDILETLNYLDGDMENMIGGTSLLPGLRTVMTEKLLQIAHATVPTRIVGDDLPAFIQDDLRPRASMLSVDMRQIDERYPIVEAEQLRLTWRITHEVTDAVGNYIATPYLADILLQTFASKAQASKRFMIAYKGWIELTPAFRDQLAEWKAQGIERFQISPQEMMGLRSVRMQTSGLRLPQIVLPEESMTLEHIARFIEILRRHGLPGGFSGLQNEANVLLVGACQRLLRDNPKAKILWIVTQRKRPSVVDALQRAQLAFSYAEEQQNGLTLDKLEGRIILTSPGVQVELAKVWTLVIFEDLDLLAFSDAQVYFYYQLERQWSLGTFSRANWIDDRRRAQQALHALQLAPENLTTFRDKYVRALPEESRTLLAKLVSPLKNAITGSAGTTPMSSVSLREPPTVRGDTPVHVAVPPETPAHGMPPPLPVWALPPKESFLAQAQRYANRTEPPTDPVLFNQPWPTYDAMTIEQQKWYFYWRSQARLGNLLPTDTGYLFLNAYEVVNLIGYSEAQNAFDYLVNIWRHYRVTVPRLDRYFVDWVADFTVVYPVSTRPLEWYDEALREGASGGSFDLCIEAWVQAGADLETLPIDYLYRLANYSPGKNKFYQEHNQQGRLDNANKIGVQAIDQLLRQTDGKSLFETFRPAALRPVQREPFAGTFYGQKDKPADKQWNPARYRQLNGGQLNPPIVIALASPWSSSPGSALSRRLTSIIKHTENIMRRQAKFKSQLQGVDLPQEWMLVLEKAFVVISAPRREVKLDMSSVDLLKRETDEIRERLLAEQDVDSTQPPALPPAPSHAVPAPVPVPVPTDSSAVTGKTLPSNLTDLPAILAIIGDVQGTRARLLRVLQQRQWQADQSVLNGAMLPGQFLNVELDYINESAFEKLGDALIFEESGLYTVAEDYRDEIDYALNQADPRPEILTSPTPAVAGSIQSTLQRVDFADLNTDWARFAQQMKPQHWEALAALVGNTDIDSRLEAVARSASTTPTRLVDDINAFALDSIGDIIIATDREPPYIEEEDRADLQALLTWAHHKALLES